MGEPHQRVSYNPDPCPRCCHERADTVPPPPRLPRETRETKPAEGDMVKRPPHYCRLDPQPLDVIEAWGLGFHEGGALKYLARWRHKGGTEDLRKGATLLLRLADLEDKRA